MTSCLCDSNVWLALSISTHSHHSAAQLWFDALDGGGSVWFCRATQHSFLRLITTAAVVAPYGVTPLTNEGAWAALDAILTDDRIALDPGEPEGLDLRWREFAARSSPSPKLWMDAYLAAFARTGGYRMVTTDAAFRQFDGLDLVVLGNDCPPA